MPSRRLYHVRSRAKGGGDLRQLIIRRVRVAALDLHQAGKGQAGPAQKLGDRDVELL